MKNNKPNSQLARLKMNSLAISQFPIIAIKKRKEENKK